MQTRKRRSIALIAIGIVAIAVVIWFGQPLIPGIRGTHWADPAIRGAIAGTLVAVYSLAWLLRLLVRHQRHKRLIKYLLQHADSNAAGGPQKGRRSWWQRRNDAVGERKTIGNHDYGGISSAPWGSPEQQHAEVREHFKGTLWAARKVRDDNGKHHSLKDLPWLLVIGGHNAGKGQFLENAGLPFPMAEVQAQNPIRGSGSSRDCQWWFHQSAVLIEASGRLVSQDSIAEDDQGDWRALLEFLSGFPGGPLVHSVVLLINIEQLLDDRRREQEIATLQARINELREQLGEKLQFLLVLTHMDAIAGFSDSFEQASPAFRHQYWGIPIQTRSEPDTETEYAPQLEKAWADLLRRLDDTAMERLQAEPALDNRVAAFAFLNQLQRFRGTLLDLVVQLFDSQPRLPNLKGVFFSSATQTPARQDWLSTELSQLLSINAQLPAMEPELPRGYFVRGPLHQYAIPFAAAPTTPGRSHALIRKLSLAILLSAAILPLLSWSYNLIQNQRLISTLKQQIGSAQAARPQLRNASADAISMLPYLDALAAASQVFPAYAPMLLRTGLYQGDRLGSAAKLAYQRALRNQWLPALTLSLKTYLLRDTASRSERRQAAMLYSSLDDPDRLDQDAFRQWFEQQWQPQPEATRNALIGHLDGLLHLRLQPQSIDYSLARRP